MPNPSLHLARIVYVEVLGCTSAGDGIAMETETRLRVEFETSDGVGMTQMTGEVAKRLGILHAFRHAELLPLSDIE